MQNSDHDVLSRLILDLMVLQKVNTPQDIASEIIAAGFHR